MVIYDLDKLCCFPKNVSAMRRMHCKGRKGAERRLSGTPEIVSAAAR